jgi:hypothetical protein
MEQRDETYLKILHFALLRIRELATAGRADYCAIEADHVHNIPSLIGEPNELRHAFYLEAERKHYLERVDRTLPGLQFTLARYAELWAQLEALASGARETTSE